MFLIKKNLLNNCNIITLREEKRILKETKKVRLTNKQTQSSTTTIIRKNENVI